MFAEAQAVAAAQAVEAEITGSMPEPYTGSGVCFVDTGQEKAAPAQAEMLAQEGPRIVLEPPSAEGLRAKQRFESERLARWFGY